MKKTLRWVAKYFSIIAVAFGFAWAVVKGGFDLDTTVKAHAQAIPKLQAEVSDLPVIRAKINYQDQRLDEIQKDVKFLVRQTARNKHEEEPTWR